MKCTKKIVLTAYKVQFVDLREPKPRTPQEEIYVADQDWHEAMSIVGLNVRDVIVKRYERGGFHAYSVQQIKPKCVAELDLNQLYIAQLRESITDREIINLSEVQGASACDAE